MKTKEIKLRIWEYQPIRFYNNRFDDIYNEALEKYNEKYFNQSINLLEVYIDKVFNFFYEPYYTLSKIYWEIWEKDKSLLYKELGDFVLTVRKWYNNKLIEKSFLKCQKYISKFPQEKILVSTLNLSSFFL